jgi:Domain of unknown function (DUF5664)
VSEGVVMQPTEGVKHDAEKTRLDLLPWSAITAMADVLAFGAKKYSAENWRQVPEWRRRYFAAGMRHAIAWWCGQRLDPETGSHHLAHAMCCFAFLIVREQEG